MNKYKTVNGIDINELNKLIKVTDEDPARENFWFNVNNTWMNGVHSRSIIKSFYNNGKKDFTRRFPFIFEIDQPLILLGKNYGPTPIEYILNAFAGCLTNAIVFYASEKGIVIDDIESEISGNFNLRYMLGLYNENEDQDNNIKITFNITGKNLSDNEKILLCEFAKKSSAVYKIITNPFPVEISVNNKG